MPPIGLMVAMALAAIAVVLIIARYRTERQLRQSFQDLRRSQERRQLAQDRLDRSLDALGEFTALAKDELAERDVAPAANGQNAKFCSNCNGGQIRPAQPSMRRAVIMGAGGALAQRSKVRYYARRGRRRNVAGIRAQAARRLA